MKKIENIYKTVDVLGYPVFSGRLTDLDPTSSKILINTMSPNSYGIAQKDADFEKALKNTDVLVLDGVGIALGSLLLHGKNIKKIAGQDCFDYFMALANRNSWKVFFLGSTEETLTKIVDRASLEYPKAIFDSYSPPFKPTFSDQETKKMIDKINISAPDVLFVGLTAPKQEKWAFFQRDNLNVRIISTIGNVFDWYAGNSKRPAKIWINLRLEWLVRIFLRPEIFKRNTKNQLQFVKDVLLKKFHLAKKN